MSWVAVSGRKISANNTGDSSVKLEFIVTSCLQFMSDHPTCKEHTNVCRSITFFTYTQPQSKNVTVFIVVVINK